MAKTRSKTLFLFDVDGTLTKPRLPAEDWVMEFLAKVRETAYIAFVGGSDLSKIQEQLGMDCTHKFDYAFSQNGLVAMKNGELIAENVNLGQLAYLTSDLNDCVLEFEKAFW